RFPILHSRARPETRSPARSGPRDTAARVVLLALDHAHRAAALRAFQREVHLAVLEREQGVIAAHADTQARMELGAALTDDDVAGFDGLAAVHLHAEVFRVGIATVAAGAYALLVCHD